MLDLDGTTIPNSKDGMPSKKVIEALAKASKVLHVGVATARPLFMLKDISNHLKLSGPSIISGGAQVVEFPSQKVLWNKTIDINALNEVCRVLNKLNITAFVQDDNKDIILSKEYVPSQAYSVYCFDENPTEVEELINEFSHIPTIVIHKIPSWIDGKIGFVISDPLATKQNGIFEVAKLLNIETHEIIGVGDGYNDFPLLMACGLKIAMGNAVQELKEIADYIAPSVDEDGVAWVIEKFVLNK